MNGLTNSEILWGKIRLAENRLFAATHTFWNHPDLSVLLPRFLIQTHCLMRHGLALMAVARDRALSGPQDPVARDLVAYLSVHIEEEAGHDAWLLDDICSLGFEPQQVLHAPPCAATAALIDSQYHWIRQLHPVAIMGYLILMEGYAPLVSQLDEIKARSGAPETAFRCLRRHAEDDPQHLAELNAALDRMSLTVDQTRAVGMSALTAIDCVASMFEELQETSADKTPEDLLYARA
jgi:pyrroloquinoline quinone (PQQ) biosynthesis protein C